VAQPKMILYRGVRMAEGWPEKIIAAQQFASIRFQGRDVPRIRYGNGQGDRSAETIPCPDCGVLKGDFHVPSCDVEECPVCGRQLISCDCKFEDLVRAANRPA
jgi:hypothetical protein